MLEDTDIFHVLTRQPPQPEVVVTRNKKLYEISTDGTIREGKHKVPASPYFNLQTTPDSIGEISPFHSLTHRGHPELSSLRL